MSKKNVLIKGTLILTAAGLASRVIGFFYRIFLSSTIGAEGMGIFQLITPVYAFCVSFACYGIQTAISRFVAETSHGSSSKSGLKILYSGIILSLTLSIIISLIIFDFSEFIAANILHEQRCENLLIYIALSIPLDAIHSCVSGYYLGLKRTAVPAWSQLIEQIVKLCAVYLIVMVSVSNGIEVTPVVAVIGILSGEISSCLFSVFAIIYEKNSADISDSDTKSILFYSKMIFSVAYILTINRVMLNILQSCEAILIPYTLKLSGLTNSAALSIYGILTGMSLPLIMFPLAIVNAIAVMLLPTIAEAKNTNSKKTMEHVTLKSIYFCIFFGFICTLFFILFGQKIGTFIFNNSDAGNYITTLAWLCPFLSLSTTFGSILHGLGKTTTAFVHNVISVSIRVISIMVLVPSMGIKGYLIGLLISQLVVTFLHGFYVNKEIPFWDEMFVKIKYF